MTSKILWTFALLVSLAAATFGQATGADFGLDPQNTEIGFVDVSDAQSTPNIQQLTMTLPQPSGTFTATLSTTSVSGLELRNRSAITGGDFPLLLEDLVGTRSAGGGLMTLVLSGLDDGWYQFDSWHNDSDTGGAGFSANSTIDISLNGAVQVSNLAATNTTDGTLAARGTFQFQVANGSSVSIAFTHVAYDAALAQMVALNGFAVTQLDYWVGATGGTIPAGAFVGGHSAGGADISICRALHNNALRPGRIDHHSGSPGCHITHGTQRIHVTASYDVLDDPTASWVTWNGAFPANAIIVDHNQGGQPIYICQAQNPNASSSRIPGKLNAQGKCTITYAITSSSLGKVKQVTSGFKILVQN